MITTKRKCNWKFLPSAVLLVDTCVMTSSNFIDTGPCLLVVFSCMKLSWFPFILYDTDWMGREVYHGDPMGNAYQIDAYDRGVRQGAFGLLLNSVNTSLDYLHYLMKFVTEESDKKQAYMFLSLLLCL